MIIDYPMDLLVDWEYQSLMTMCNLEKSDDGDYNIKVLRQKFFIDGLEYIFHEVFGLENKATPKEEVMSLTMMQIIFLKAILTFIIIPIIFIGY